MERPLKEHISFLESRVQELNGNIMQNRQTQVERNRLDAEIRAAQLALTYYRKALELEKEISYAAHVSRRVFSTLIKACPALFPRTKQPWYKPTSEDHPE